MSFGIVLLDISPWYLSPSQAGTEKGDGFLPFTGVRQSIYSSLEWEGRQCIV